MKLLYFVEVYLVRFCFLSLFILGTFVPVPFFLFCRAILMYLIVLSQPSTLRTASKVRKSKVIFNVGILYMRR